MLITDIRRKLKLLVWMGIGTAILTSIFSSFIIGLLLSIKSDQ